MNPTMKIVFLVVVALVVPLFFLLTLFISTYHRLVLLRTRVKSDFGRLELELKHRDELLAQGTHNQNAAANGSPETVLSVRQAYNESAAAYNRQRKAFPGNLIAALLNFAPAQPLGDDS